MICNHAGYPGCDNDCEGAVKHKEHVRCIEGFCPKVRSIVQCVPIKKEANSSVIMNVNGEINGKK